MFKNLLSKKYQIVNNIVQKYEYELKIKDPLLYKKMGFSATFKNGEKIKNANQVESGDLIEVFLNGGSFLAKVEEVKKDDN